MKKLMIVCLMTAFTILNTSVVSANPEYEPEVCYDEYGEVIECPKEDTKPGIQTLNWCDMTCYG